MSYTAPKPVAAAKSRFPNNPNTDGCSICKHYIDEDTIYTIYVNWSELDREDEENGFAAEMEIVFICNEEGAEVPEHIFNDYEARKTVEFYGTITEVDCL